MNAKILGYSDKMTHDRWLGIRRTGLTGSDAPAITGVSKYRTRITVYLDKIDDIKPEEKERQQELFYWGHIQEPVIRKEFGRRTGMKVKKCNAILQHLEYPWLLGNIDGLVTDPEVGEAGLECKNVSSFNSASWEDDGIPEDYQVQCYHYMMVTGIKRWWIAALIGGNRFVFRKIDWDQELIDSLLQIEKGFWKLIVDRTPPALDGSDACGDVIKRLYADSVDQEIYLPSNYEQLCNDYLSAKQALTAAEELKNLKQYELQAALGAYQKGKVGKFTISWKPVDRTSIDTSRLKSERPDIYAAYVNTSSSRRFSIR